MGKAGWYSRGYLPHFDAPGLVQFITFRLFDSLPEKAVERMVGDFQHLPPEKQNAERRRELDRLLDRGYGKCYLRRPEIAQIVQRRLIESDGEECMVLGWCLMPNHVHVVCELSDDTELWKLVKSWKGSTAVECNRMLQRTGSFWYREYFDRFIRDQTHLKHVLRYVEQNPVKAGLCPEPESWPWSSASLAE